MTLENSEWPFDSPPNVACITVRSIVDVGKPVLMATRDADDGAWQFLTGDAFEEAEVMLVSLRSMVERDSTLLELADVHPGWMAWREHHDSPWNRQAVVTQTEQ